MFEPIYNAFINISKILRNTELHHIGMDTSDTNASNDIQKPIDIITNNILKDCVEEMPEFIGYISEEEKELTIIRKERKKGFILVFDPLDGSKNVLSNLTVGTIYGIYEYDVDSDEIVFLVQSGYCLYGPSTLLVKTDQYDVSLFQLKNDSFEFQKKIELLNAKNEKMYSINASYDYGDKITELVKIYNENGYTQRWLGAMVADTHQLVMRGGLFLYPGNKKMPNGKIRLLYEALPMAHIITLLGGKAINTNGDIILGLLDGLKLKSGEIHGTTPLIMCSENEYEKLKHILNE